MPSVLWRCWLGGRKGIRPVKNLSGGVLALLSVRSEMQTCMWPSWCHCHWLSLASVKSRLVLSCWYLLTRVVPEKGPLNVCVCVRNKIGITGLAFRPHHLHAVHRCTLFLLILHIAWSVCWTHRWALQNIWIGQDAVWGRMCWLKKPCDRSGVHWHHPMDTMNNICTGMMRPYVRLLCHLLTFIRAYNMTWCCGE